MDANAKLAFEDVGSLDLDNLDVALGVGGDPGAEAGATVNGTTVIKFRVDGADKDVAFETMSAMRARKRCHQGNNERLNVKGAGINRGRQ